ncbi:hypothetical protein WN943_025537 [Citrus x changshan-huyou]
METQCSDFLDGTSEGQVSRFRGFLQESICSWIRVIMMLLMGSSIETSPSALHLLSMDEASKTSSPINTKFLSVSYWRLAILDIHNDIRKNVKAARDKMKREEKLVAVANKKRTIMKL